MPDPPSRDRARRTVDDMDNRDEVRDFLTTRRERLTPEQAGVPFFGGKQRVKGLRREEVAMLAGMSTDYYTRLERGNLTGVSHPVLESLARALQLDEAERAHLFDLADTANSSEQAAARRPARLGERRAGRRAAACSELLAVSARSNRCARSASSSCRARARDSSTGWETPVRLPRSRRV